MRERVRQIYENSQWSLTCLDTRRKPIRRSQGYRKIRCLLYRVCETHAPRRHGANRPSQVFDDVGHPCLKFRARKTLDLCEQPKNSRDTAVN
jgi:hypothetical protein